MIVQLNLTRKDLTFYARWNYRSAQILLWDFGSTRLDFDMAHRVVFTDDSGFTKILKDRRPDEPTSLSLSRPHFESYDAVKVYLQETRKRIEDHIKGLDE